ncbi:MAG: carbamate kinase [Sulfolobales archaeon]
MRPLLVIALGGNAILKKGEKGLVEEQWNNIRTAARAIVSVFKRGYNIVVTHGNGPQVGNLAEWFESLKNRIPPLTLDIAGAMTQGWIGYMLQIEIGNILEEEGFERKVISIINTVLVDPRDPAFDDPTKFIGPYYSREEALKISLEKKWLFKEDPRGGWRRVVPSPKPVANIEIEAIRTLLEKGFIVIASGGGGVPVYRDKNVLKGVEAVIDKDLSSSVLAIGLRASKLVILTDVDGVYLNFGRPDAVLIKDINLEEAMTLIRRGFLGEGSMKPKVEACVKYVAETGFTCHIGHLEKAVEVVEGKSGTTIHS